MIDRIEKIYQVADQIMHAIKHNETPMTNKIIDPNTNLPASWPESWQAYKAKVQAAEKQFGRHRPLSELQWRSIELYLRAQYNAIFPITAPEVEEDDGCSV